MALRVGIQMDPIGEIDISGDTSFALALEAQRRGHELFYYEPDRLAMRDGQVSAAIQPLQVADALGAHFELGAASITDLRDLDVILMRQDPPFDMHYISATHMLERVHPDTLVVNDPAAVRNAPEKIFPVRFAGLLPDTLITRDRAALDAFRAEFGDIILKPVFGNGGAGIFRIGPDDENFGALVDMFVQTDREPIIAQRYLPEVRAGDKRVILVEGEAVGALNRVPAAGDARANVHVGGTPEAAGLTDRDLEIAHEIGPVLRDMGIVFAGIDIIGAHLTEINVTSPTCIREIKAFGGPDIAVMIWDAIEARLAG
ncbi:MAG: glutathione synthase [PS1 clade bacterium]|nr:glutathione synthase [PS1 clade bacterium]CAI8410510.1 MAG: Glutathione synthetase [Rhodobiaceae bacterium UBA7378]